MLHLQREDGVICRIIVSKKEKEVIIMKRLIALFLSLMMLVLAFTACAQSSDTSSDVSDASSESSAVSDASDESKVEEKALVRIAGMKGPTSIGMVEIMENDEKGTTKNDYEFTIAGTADEITLLLKKGELDIAAVPANLASVLYNNTNGEIQILGVNTLGVLYLVAKGVEINSIDDLKGKTIIATGKGTTPEYTLTHILKEKGIEDVTLDFKAEATEVVAALSQVESGIAMLPQPYVTVAQGKVEGLEIVMDLNKEWKAINSDNGIVTGVFVVRKAFAEENPTAVKNFIEEYKVSSAYVNENVEEAAQLVEKFGIFAANVAVKAIPYCNIACIVGEDMKTPVNTYLGVLYANNEKSVGGKLPENDFFYIAE